MNSINSEDELRAKIFHDAEITYEPFTKEDYKTEHIAKINLNNLMKLVRSYTRTLQRQHERELVEARVDENNMYIKELPRHYFPAGLGEPHIPLVQFYERIAELTNNQEGEK